MALNENLLTFDDSLFETTQARTATNATAAQIQFQPNIISPKWFQQSRSDDSPQTLKYKADLLFYKGDFRTAAEIYQECIKAVPDSNRTLLRDATESLIWCFMRLGDLATAKEHLRSFTEALIASTSTFEQRTPCLFLGVQVYRACGLSHEYQLALKRGLCAHPLYADWWMELGTSLLEGHHTDLKIERLEALSIHNSTSPVCQGVEFARICLGLAETLSSRQAHFSSSFAQIHAREVSAQAANLLTNIPGPNIDLTRCLDHFLERSTDMKNPIVFEEFENSILEWTKTD